MLKLNIVLFVMTRFSMLGQKELRLLSFQMSLFGSITPSIKCAGSHLYTWVERGKARVKCLAKELNAISLDSAGTQTDSRSGVERPNQWRLTRLQFEQMQHIRCSLPTAKRIKEQNQLIYI